MAVHVHTRTSQTTHTYITHREVRGHSTLRRDGKRLTVKYTVSWRLSHLFHVFLCTLFISSSSSGPPRAHSCAASPAPTPGYLDAAAPRFSHSTHYEQRGEGGGTERKQNWLIREEIPWAAPPGSFQKQFFYSWLWRGDSNWCLRSHPRKISLLFLDREHLQFSWKSTEEIPFSSSCSNVVLRAKPSTWHCWFLTVFWSECQWSVTESSISSYTSSFPASVKRYRWGIFITVFLKDSGKAGYTLFCKISKAVRERTSSWCDVSVEIVKAFDTVAQKSFILTSYVQKH